MARKSGHGRKLWRVIIKLPSRLQNRFHQTVDIDINEFTYEALGSNAGVAINRAMKKLRLEPSLKDLVLRDCFISIKWLDHYSLTTEAQEKGVDPKTLSKSGWDQYMRVEGFKEYSNFEPFKSGGKGGNGEDSSN